MKQKIRTTVATISGLICGFICYRLASSSEYGLLLPIVFQLISSRMLIGLAIGISNLSQMPWFVHGPLLGAVFSLPISFSGMVVEVPGFSKISMFFSTILMGLIYGFLIELVTTVVFRAGIKK
ncbi:hypothetical protein ACFLZP_01240 [Patescibacteria group bacterium]